MGCCLWIPYSEFHLGVPVLYLVYYSLASVTVLINIICKIVCCNWILIQPCTEVDNAMCQQTQLHTWNYRTIISLSLICYIQCGFSISYISICGIAAHDRYNVSHVFLFNSNVVLCLLPLLSILLLWLLFFIHAINIII